MKRSEAVKKLQDIILHHMNCECCHTEEEMYSTMLAEIEQFMLPPTAQLRGLGGFFKDNAWELEDESK